MTEEQAQMIIAEVSARMIKKPIETDRLCLRRFGKKDFSDYYEYMCQKELCRLCGQDPPESEEEERIWFEMNQLAQQNRFAIVYKENNKVIGFFSLAVYPFVKEDKRLENLRGISLSLGINENYQRKGLMTELLRAAIAYLFTECGLDFVNSGYFEFNEGSRRIQEKAGMKHYMDHVFERNGERINTKEMIIFREQWLAEHNSEKRSALNAVYEPLDKRANMLFGMISKEKLGFELSGGFYNGHFRKNGQGSYEKDYYPIPEISLRGLCDIEIGFFETCVTSKLKTERLPLLDAGILAPYRFSVYGVEEWESDLGDQSDFAAAVQNAANSPETEVFFSFAFDAEADAAELIELMRILIANGFYY